MDRRQAYQPRGPQDATQSNASSSSQATGVPQTPLHGLAPPSYGPIYYQFPGVYQPMNLQPIPQLAPQHIGGLPSMAVNGALPAGMQPPLMLQPNPYAQVPLQPVPAAVYPGAMPAAPAELLFDPSTPAPFADSAPIQTPRRHGVLKIENIPYTISIPEMNQFIGRHIPGAHLIEAHNSGYPIHIIMERSTGKTMDAYIELKSPEDAVTDLANGFGYGQMNPPRIGQRVVEVSLSNQAELMKDLFPRAKCIHWDNDENGAPKLVANRDPYSSGFKCFVTAEEMTCMVRHAEYPQRSQFATRSMNRPFECMISTCYKFPWYATNLYTTRQTQEFFSAFMRQLDVLLFKVNATNIPREVGLDHKLLFDLTAAGLNTSGFSMRQKSQIIDTSVVVGPGFYISSHAKTWPFQTLSPHPQTLSDQDIGMWLEILNIGMGVMESQGRPFIGIFPHLSVVRDTDGHILFMPTEQGLDLKRAQFSLLEKRMMEDLLDYGWNVYLPQMGIEPSTLLDSPMTQAIKNSLQDIGPRASETDRSGIEESNDGRADTGAYTVNEHGRRQLSEGSITANNLEDDFEFLQAGDMGVGGESLNDPEQALEAMRQVVDEVRQAPPPGRTQNKHTQAVQAAQATILAELNCLGAGLDNVALDTPSNPASRARYVPPGRRHGTQDNSQVAPALNPETAAYEPRQAQATQFGKPLRFPASTPFTGRGLGNGDFNASPPPATNRRSSSFGSNVDKTKGKESALTAPAASVRLLPALDLPPLIDPQQVPHGRVRFGQVLTYGDPRGAKSLLDPAANVAQPQGVVSRDLGGRSAVPTLGSAPTIVPAHAQAPAAVGNSQLQASRTRPSNEASPKHSLDGKSRSPENTGIDDATAIAIMAQLNMRTASDGTLAAPSTPPPNGMPSPGLRRSPAREHLRAGYEVEENPHMDQAERTVTTAPTTPARTMLRRNLPANLNTSSAVSNELSTVYGGSGGTHLPFTPGLPTQTRNNSTFGAVGDASPGPRTYTRPGPAGRARTNLPQLPVDSESAEETHARNVAIFRAAVERGFDLDKDD